MLRCRWPIYFLLLTAWVGGGTRAFSATPDGARIYSRQCASCHGQQGQGVKKKYEEPLHGDWSIERLSRYIHRSMPDDKPKSLKPEEAEAVARYIYGEFYTAEARLRKHPPRVELVRLTNRQYVHTVADLLRSFVEPNATPGKERGLRAFYRDGRNKAFKSIQRVDPAVEFDFLAEGSEPRLASTNGLDVSWRGALIAEESGDYEFILKTTCGARLWVNNDNDREPTIDAGVASGAVDEHKVTVRLLGGRVYPIRLEWFKNPKDKLASVALRWTPPHGATQTIPARCLAPINISPTFVVSVPFPADDSSQGYERGIGISKEWDEAATQAAIRVANHVGAQLDRYAGTKPGAPDRKAKAMAFSAEFVSRAFRRPLSPPETNVFVEAHFKSAPKVEDAVKRVVLLALKSPRFLYANPPAGKADDYQVATRLAVTLWDSIPDRELIRLAAQGGLHSREQIEAQARRMLGDSRARAKVLDALHHWLHLGHVETLAKDDKLFPGFTPEIIADLRTSLNLFLEDAVWGNGSDYRRLLLASDLFVNGRLAAFYGIKSNAGEDFVKVPLDAGQPSGVLTHPYLLAAFSYPKSTSPIHRGVFLTRNIVGRTLRQPPEAVAFKDEEFPANLTMREKITALTKSETCQSCHGIINPLGFSLEQYDAVGRFRTRDGERPVNAVSEFANDDGTTVRFTGPRDVAQFALGSAHGQQTFIEQMFHQFVKQPVLAYGPDNMKRLRENFVASGFNVQKLLVEIAVTAAYHGVESAKNPGKK